MAREGGKSELTDLLVGIKESGNRSPDSGNERTSGSDGHGG